MPFVVRVLIFTSHHTMLDVLTIKLCLLSKPVTPFVGIEFH
nr:MAG TPA: hypothetical protein [Caudoviricetes sp.]